MVEATQQHNLSDVSAGPMLHHCGRQSCTYTTTPSEQRTSTYRTRPANNVRLQRERYPERFETVAHRINVENAFRHVGLGRYLFPDEDGNPSVAALITFEGDLQFSHHQLGRLAPLAGSALTTRYTPRPEGALKLDAEVLGSCLILMGNAIMRIATIDHREWSDANKEDWEEMVTAIWRLLSPYHGVRLDSRAMLHAMMATVVEVTMGRVRPFLCDPYLLDDTILLPFFILARAGEWMPRHTVQAEFEARRITQPLALPRTADSRTYIHADRFEAQAFPPRFLLA